ncbi:MAG: N-acetylglucosamine-6-phosphate deacetylase [bacterium]
MSGELILIGGTVVTPHEEIREGVVFCKDGLIQGVYARDEVGAIPRKGTVDLRDMMICPGLIDIHLHGALGVDFLDAGPDDYDRILRFHLTHGTTTIVPTLMTAPLEGMGDAARRIADWQASGHVRGMIRGLHLEGPFLSPEKPGAHHVEDLLLPNTGDLAYLMEASRGNIAILTMAPELEGAPELIRFAGKQGIIVSIGHSCASHDKVREAIDLGANHACHFFNAMGVFHHREPGVIGTLLIASHITAELIVDGLHVHPIAAQILLRMLGADRVVLVTDCSPLVGLEEGEYAVTGQGGHKRRVGRVEDDSQEGVDTMTYIKGRITGSRGCLAGSSLSLPQAIKNCRDFGLAPLSQAVAMATTNPARLLCAEREIGRIAPGFRADITVLDQECNPRLVIKGGERVVEGVGEKTA